MAIRKTITVVAHQPEARAVVQVVLLVRGQVDHHRKGLALEAAVRAILVNLAMARVQAAVEGVQALTMALGGQLLQILAHIAKVPLTGQRRLVVNRL